MKPIGSPPQIVEDWLEAFARDNDAAARRSLLPWNRAKYRGQAWAFRTARRLIDQAEGRAPAAADYYIWP